jgi:hypothetical protein
MPGVNGIGDHFVKRNRVSPNRTIPKQYRGIQKAALRIHTVELLNLQRLLVSWTGNSGSCCLGEGIELVLIYVLQNGANDLFLIGSKFSEGKIEGSYSSIYGR